MTDETINMEPVAVEPVATEPPVQPTSDNTTDPSAIDEEALKAIIEPLVKDAFDRGAQSTKDKRIAKQESRISSLEDTLAQFEDLKADGMSKKQAIQYMRTQELLDAQGNETPPVVPPAQEPAAQATVAVDEGLSSALNLAGLTSNDADVVTILRDNNDLSKKLIAINALVESRKQVTTPGSAAAVLPSGTGAAVTEETFETVSAELQELHEQPKMDFAKNRELNEKLKKLRPITK